MTWKKKKKFWNFYGIHYINIVDINREMYERNGLEKVADNDGISWLNEKHIEEGLDHKNLQEPDCGYSL